MIGIGDSCEGSFGTLCPDEVLRNTCLDLSLYTDQELPIDPRSYLLFENNTLEIGACNPESQPEVVLRNEFSADH